MLQGNAASFYVGVRHPQVSGSALLTVSHVQQLRHSQSSVSEEDSLDDVSEDDWQPSEEIEDSANSFSTHGR